MRFWFSGINGKSDDRPFFFLQAPSLSITDSFLSHLLALCSVMTCFVHFYNIFMLVWIFDLSIKSF